MRFNSLHINRIYGLLLISVTIVACNSKGYQNLTARFNGHYYANLRLEEVNQALDDAYTYNYNDILKIYPDIDSSVISSNKAKLDDAFKKASQLVDWHSASDYVDDGYLIAGKIRHLRGEFQEAIQTLQYVYQTSEDENARHAALITLMRTYMDMGDMDLAEQVSGYLEDGVLSAENNADFRLTMAYFHQRQNNLRGIAQNLNEVSDIIKDKDERSRSKFILGQIYQKLGFNSEAFDFYKSSLAGNPPYELTFHAKLNMQQVADFSSSSDVERIRKFYAGLLKDGKNVEYRDKIYYEMGEFEKKRSNFDLALENYLLSVGVESTDQRQQGLSFLRAGQLYYDHYLNFELAKIYYDSTVAALPKDEPGYEGIVERQEVLTEFVTQLNIIQKNDSLLSLSEMSPIALEGFVENYLVEKKRKERAVAKKKKTTQSSTGIDRVDRSTTITTPEESGTWYFYNSAALDQGEIEFERTWGNRPLEDNWRRSQKDRVQNDRPTNTIPSEDPNQVPEIAEFPEESGLEAEKATLIASVPKSEEEKEALHLEMQEAYFKLGGVYQFGLNQIERAVGSYQTVVDKYPKSSYRPQSLFALYSIFRETDPNRAESYKSQIIADYPETIMAKTLINPNYLIEKEQRNRELQRIYAGAFYDFEAGNYRRAENTLVTALDTIEDVDFLPNAHLLLAIMKAKTENLFSYEKALNEFIKDYSSGELHDYAQNLLEGINPVKSNIIRRDDFEYSEDFEQLHIVTILYSSDKIDTDSLQAELETFNAFLHPQKKLTLGLLDFDTETSQAVIFINSFTTKELALEYDNSLGNALANFVSIKPGEFDNFVISKDNFNMLFQSKKLEEYRTFYNRFYK